MSPYHNTTQHSTTQHNTMDDDNDEEEERELAQHIDIIQHDTTTRLLSYADNRFTLMTFATGTQLKYCNLFYAKRTHRVIRQWCCFLNKYGGRGNLGTWLGNGYIQFRILIVASRAFLTGINLTRRHITQCFSFSAQQDII